MIPIWLKPKIELKWGKKGVEVLIFCLYFIRLYLINHFHANFNWFKWNCLSVTVLNGRVENESSDAKSTIIILIRVNWCQLWGRCTIFCIYEERCFTVFQWRSWKWLPVIKSLWIGACFVFIVQRKVLSASSARV